MEFNNYQILSKETATELPSVMDGDFDLQLARYTLGVVDEAGEVAGKIKKYLRGDDISFEELKEDVKKELGDVLWYISTVSTLMEIDLNDVARLNIEKLQSRLKRGKIKGNGDNR